MNASMANNYLGIYEWVDSNSYSITITKKGDTLFLEYADDGQSNSLALEVMDAENAINIETGQRLKFKRNKAGKVTGVLWRNRFEFRKR